MAENREQKVAAARRRRLIGKLAELRLDALLVTAPPNIRYLSAFTGEDSSLLVGAKWAVLVTDGRFTTQAQRECPSLDLHIRRGSMAQAIAHILRGRKIRRIGLEAEHATLELKDRLSEVISGKKLIATCVLVAGLRDRKDENEIATIRRAVKVAEQAFLGLIKSGKKAFIGRSETQVAGELEYRMRQTRRGGRIISDDRGRRRQRGTAALSAWE